MVIPVLSLSLLTSCSTEELNDLLETDSGSVWIDSDMAESFEGVGEIRLQDDFAAAVNREWVTTTDISGPLYSEIYTAEYVRMGDLIRYGDYSDPEFQELQDYVQLASKWEHRDSQGVEPLRKYLEAIESISTTADLYDYICDPELNPLAEAPLGFSTGYRSEEDSDRTLTVLYHPEMTFCEHLGKENNYRQIGTDQLALKAQTDDITKYILGRLGYSDEYAEKLLRDCYSYEKRLMDSTSHIVPFTENMSTYDLDEMTEAAGGFPLTKYLDAWGFTGTGQFMTDITYLKKLEKNCSGSRIEGFKAMAAVAYINRLSGRFLDQDAMSTITTLSGDRTEQGEAEEASDEEGGGEEDAEDDSYNGMTEDEYAAAYVFSNYVSELPVRSLMAKYYIKEYFTPEEHARLREMTDEIIQCFREDIPTLDWLSDEGKKSCIEKLDSMNIRIITPDYENTDFSDIQITSASEGGSFLDAYLKTYVHQTMNLNRRASLPYDRGYWNPDDPYSSTLDVNSYYVTTNNTFYILAGILDYPAYRQDMTYEELLAGVGTIIAHEITHGFDDGGVIYDKEGVKNQLLSDEDQKNFNDMADRVKGYFSSIRPYPEADYIYGSDVSAEAIADIGGMKLCLLCAARHEGFDYDTFFRYYALQYAINNTVEMEADDMTDTHPLAYLRINVPLAQYDIFQETYGIGPGDGMYVAPEDRITIW